MPPKSFKCLSCDFSCGTKPGLARHRTVKLRVPQKQLNMIVDPATGLLTPKRVLTNMKEKHMNLMKISREIKEKLNNPT